MRNLQFKASSTGCGDRAEGVPVVVQPRDALSIPACWIQPVEPVYQVQPPWPSMGVFSIDVGGAHVGLRLVAQHLRAVEGALAASHAHRQMGERTNDV